MFADSSRKFKCKSGSIFQMDGRKAKLSQFIFLELFFGDVLPSLLAES